MTGDMPRSAGQSLPVPTMQRGHHAVMFNALAVAVKEADEDRGVVPAEVVLSAPPCCP